MTLPRLLPAAEAEVTAAAQWYEARRDGLGVDFVAALEATLERIERMPETFPRWRSDREYRKTPVKRFPYLVFYQLVDGDIEVVAVAHTKRRPGYWTDR